MTCPSTALSFRSPSFNLQPPLPQRRPSRHDDKMIPGWGRRTRLHGIPLKLTQMANATGGSLDKNARRRGSNSTSLVPPSPLSDVIQELYSSINDKDMKRLEKLTAPDCTIEDTAFYKPLDAKNSTHAYFKRLMEAMGKNVEFVVDEVCQGVVEPTAAVMWHLEWKGKTIPFTKGCSFYICSANGPPLLIRKIHIFDESPLKPGKLALEILNFVTNLFDTFPNMAQGFLKNPDALVQPCVRFFNFFLKPIIVPLLAYYTRFWTCVARALTMVLNILYKIYIQIGGIN